MFFRAGTASLAGIRALLHYNNYLFILYGQWAWGFMFFPRCGDTGSGLPFPLSLISAVLALWKAI